MKNCKGKLGVCLLAVSLGVSSVGAMEKEIELVPLKLKQKMQDQQINEYMGDTIFNPNIAPKADSTKPEQGKKRNIGQFIIARKSYLNDRKTADMLDGNKKTGFIDSTFPYFSKN